MPVDSLKTGWRGSEFWLCLFVALAGTVLAFAGHPWPGMVGASVAAVGYGIARGVTKAAYTARGGSNSRTL